MNLLTNTLSCLLLIPSNMIFLITHNKKKSIFSKTTLAVKVAIAVIGFFLQSYKLACVLILSLSLESTGISIGLYLGSKGFADIIYSLFKNSFLNVSQGLSLVTLGCCIINFSHFLPRLGVVDWDLKDTIPNIQFIS